MITDSQEIENRFCQYFANVGPNLASMITPVSFSEYLTQLTSSSLHNFDRAQMNELDELKDDNAPGLDNLPMSVIKKSFGYFYL